MTLLDLDLDTIQHLDFDVEEPVVCDISDCSKLADFNVTPPCNHVRHFCGECTKVISHNSMKYRKLRCSVCDIKFPPESVVYTPIK